MKSTAAIRILALCFYAFITAVSSSASRQAAPVVSQQNGGVSGRRAIEIGPENICVVASTDDNPTTVTLDGWSDVVPGPPPGVRVQWFEYASNNVNGVVISDNDVVLEHPNKESYRIVNDQPTRFGLEISNVDLIDGGTYVIQDTHASVPDVTAGQAELIVLATAPNCTTTLPANGMVIEGHLYTTQCAVNYQGNLAPQMTWSGPGPYTVTENTSPTAVFSHIQFAILRTMDVQFYACVTDFANLGPLPPGSASNKPAYTFRYQAQQMFVYWGPLNMTYYPVKPTYEVGDLVTGYADAKPAATYSWYNLRTNENILSDTFPVTADFFGLDTMMRCQAQNTINGQIYSSNVFVTISVPLPTTPTITTPATTTTEPPAEADCDDLTGTWQARNPNAQLILYVDQNSEIGQVVGTFKNDTDTYFVEVVGIADREGFGYVGLTVIWPFVDGVTGHAGECHRCMGQELLFIDSLWRSIDDSFECGDGGSPTATVAYAFTRTGTLKDAQKEVYNVWKPTHISKEILGLTLK